jgi:tryptophan synthase beta chain
MQTLKQIIFNTDGHFGPYGGAYIPEVLVPTMKELREAFYSAIEDPAFHAELNNLRAEYCGRPTPLTFAKNLTDQLGGAKIFIKNEGLNHTGAHKMNHCLGQILLAKRMGKKRIVAETGAGQHGLATATVCAKFGLECIIYMGKKDYDRQRPNVFFMETMGATVIPVYEGDQSLRDAVNAGMRDLISNPEDTLYLLGTVCGPHPYPVMNTYFQKIIGEETRQQLNTHPALKNFRNSLPLEQGKLPQAEGIESHEAKNILPDCIVACVGGGSNSIGIFYDFLDDVSVELVGVEAGGRGIKDTATKSEHAARFQTGSVGVIEGFKSYVLQTKEGQVKSTHSISAGLDYSGVGPQHAYLNDLGRVHYTYATDTEVLETFKTVAQNEGILTALECCHAMAEVLKRAAKMRPDQIIVGHVSGRGDKDLFITAYALDRDNFRSFLQTRIDMD